MSTEALVDVLKFRQLEVTACRLGDFLIHLFENLPDLDILAVGGGHLEVSSLRAQPLNPSDFFLDLLTSQGIELLHVRLELSEVVVLFFLLAFDSLKDDDTAGPIAECQVPPTAIELHDRDDVFLEYFFVGPLVPEQLHELILASLAGFFHLSSI